MYSLLIDLDIAESAVGMAASWKNDKVAVLVEGNTTDKVTLLGASTHFDISGTKVDVKGEYCLLTKKLAATVAATIDDIVATVKYDTKDKEAVLSVSKPLDSNNDLTPSVNVNTGAVKVAWLRKWEGGSLDTSFSPNDKELTFVWKDNGVNGVWTTTATVPIEEQGNTKITFARDWNY